MRKKKETSAQANETTTTTKTARKTRAAKTAKAAKTADSAAPVSSGTPIDENGEIIGRRHKYRDPEARKALIVRLNRIEGQITGIRRMVEEDIYCPDILVQTTSVKAAINGFSKELLNEHIRGCVVNDIRDGKEETIDELLRVLQKMML